MRAVVAAAVEKVVSAGLTRPGAPEASAGQVRAWHHLVGAVGAWALPVGAEVTAAWHLPVAAGAVAWRRPGAAAGAAWRQAARVGSAGLAAGAASAHRGAGAASAAQGARVASAHRAAGAASGRQEPGVGRQANPGVSARRGAPGSGRGRPGPLGARPGRSSWVPRGLGGLRPGTGPTGGGRANPVSRGFPLPPVPRPGPAPASASRRSIPGRPRTSRRTRRSPCCGSRSSCRRSRSLHLHPVYDVCRFGRRDRLVHQVARDGRRVVHPDPHGQPR